MPRAGLSRALLTARAAQLADENGWDQLTLASVADAFGVRQPSLYKHVGSLADLRREVTVRGARELSDDLMSSAVGRSGATRRASRACPSGLRVSRRQPASK